METLKRFFGFFHISIYLIDSTGKWAIFTKAAGKGSRKLKKEGAKLPVAEDSLIGRLSKHQKPYFSYSAKQRKQKNRQNTQIGNLLLPGAHSGITLPLLVKGKLIGVLNAQSVEIDAFDPDASSFYQSLANQIALGLEKAQSYAQTIAERDIKSLLNEIDTALSADLDLEAVMTIAVNLGQHLRAFSGGIYLLAGTDDIFFKSSIAERNTLDLNKKQDLVRNVLANKSPEAQALKTKQPLLIADIKRDDKWQLDQYHPDMRSFVCIPIIAKGDRFRGVLSFVHPDPNHFEQKDLELLELVTPKIVTALKNAVYFTELQKNLHLKACLRLWVKA